MVVVKLEFIYNKFVPCHLCEDCHLTMFWRVVFTRGSKKCIRCMVKMCNKANMVRRFYVLMMPLPTTIELRCVGVMKRPPTDTELRELTKRYLADPVSHIELQKVYAVPVDIPVSILF